MAVASAMNKVYLQVVGCDSIDTTPSFLLFTDTQRYLFNCGEGTQRLFNENKLRINKLNNLFFTRISWECIGGLPGMAMTLRDNGRVNLGLYGPRHFKQFIHSTRHFLFQEKLQVHCTEFTSHEDKFVDDNLTIYPVILSGEVQECCTNSSVTEENPAKRVKIGTSQVENIVSYICALPTLPGKFLVQKAKARGVPKGPFFGKLKLGEDVVLDNGRKVLAKDVTEPTQPGPVFFIIDCPSVDYISSLVQSQQFNNYKTSNQQPRLIVHLVPMEVFDNPDYKEWKLSFGDTTKHLLMNKDVCGRSTMFRSQARIQIKLHTIDKNFFPLLHSSDESCRDTSALPINTSTGSSLLKFHFRPLKLEGYDTSDIPTVLDVDEIMTETMDIIRKTGNDQHLAVINHCSGVKQAPLTSNEGNKRTMQSLSEALPSSCGGNKLESDKAMSVDGGNVDNLLVCQSKNEEDFEVVFLGTGASLPSKYRNVSATLLHVSNSSCILLDCGEGTLGQLYRHYGRDMDCVINNINCIFVSHIHADHHLGLIRVLLYKNKQRKRSNISNQDEIVVIGPTRIKLWLQEYNTFEDLNYRFSKVLHLSLHDYTRPRLHERFVNCEDIVKEDHELMGLFKRIEAVQLVAVPVIHCADAYGLVFKHTSGWKVVYSGDTRPCPSLVTAGRGATLLIHEATFEDELHEEALDKKHCTTTEAINIGIEMHAGFILLNHFSQRYPKIPVISEQFTKHTGIAFDHMRVRPRDFDRIPSLFSVLNVIFAEEIEEMSKKYKVSTTGSDVINSS